MNREYAARELADALAAFKADPCQEATSWLVVALDSYRRAWCPKATNGELLALAAEQEMDIDLELASLVL